MASGQRTRPNADGDTLSLSQSLRSTLRTSTECRPALPAAMWSSPSGLSPPTRNIGLQLGRERPPKARQLPAPMLSAGFMNLQVTGPDFKGVATKNLPIYLAWFRFFDETGCGPIALAT